jgi:SAM-dependent methyltransferase
MSTLLQKISAHPAEEAPYSQIAPVYDHMMSHVEYAAWADYVVALLDRFGNGGKRILDAGCGTGQILHELLARGYTMFGLDLSYAMLDECRKQGVTRLWQGDLRNMTLRQGVDVVICLYDTIHYLKPDELIQFFESVSGMLSSGGLVIFDVVTEAFLRGYWADYSEWDQVGNFEYTRRSWYDSENRCQHTEIRVRDEKTGKTTLERHRQWLFDIDVFPLLAEAHRLALVGRFEEYTFDPADAASDRIHFVLRREAA